MEKEKLYQTIEAYLEGELPEEELSAFEQELTTDATLAREVAIHRNLQAQLGNASKTDLRITLDAIASEFPALRQVKEDTDSDLNSSKGGERPTGRIRKMWWGIGLAAAILGGGFLLYQSSLGPKMPTAPTFSEVENNQEEPAIAETPIKEVEDLAQQVEKETPNVIPTPPIKETSPEVYNTNRELELLLGQKSPSRRYLFSDGKIDATAQGQEIYLAFDANLETSRSVEGGLYITLYRNNYPEGEVLRKPLKYNEVEGEPKMAFGAEVKYYSTAFTDETNLDPALYYGVVTAGDSKEPLWVGKVKVE